MLVFNCRKFTNQHPLLNWYWQWHPSCCVDDYRNAPWLQGLWEGDGVGVVALIQHAQNWMAAHLRTLQIRVVCMLWGRTSWIVAAIGPQVWLWVRPSDQASRAGDQIHRPTGLGTFVFALCEKSGQYLFFFPFLCVENLHVGMVSWTCAWGCSRAQLKLIQSSCNFRDSQYLEQDWCGP